MHHGLCLHGNRPCGQNDRQTRLKTLPSHNFVGGGKISEAQNRINWNIFNCLMVVTDPKLTQED